VDIAAHYLVPVLFRDDAAGEEEADAGTNPIEAEKALKRCLRQCERVWRGTANTDGRGASNKPTPATADAGVMIGDLPSSNQQERQASRKRLSDLILGTSVMRMRHYWHVLNERGDKSLAAALTALARLEPHIVGLEPWMMVATNGTGTSKANEINYAARDDGIDNARRDIARELARLHAQYLLRSNSTATTTEAGQLLHWPTDTIQRVAVQQSLPSFIVRLLVDQYGAQDAEALCRLANKPGPIMLRRNAIRCESNEMLMQRLWEEDEIKSFVPDAFTMPTPSGCIRLDFDGGSSASERPSKSLWSLKAWREGWFEVMDAGSQLIVKSINIQHTDIIVVDYCAGNGGKTLALASAMWEVRQGAEENLQTGIIVAHDIVASRLKQIQGSLDRAGLSGGKENDGDMLHNDIPAIQTTSNATSICEGMADAVLVDAPCSSLGVLRRRPGHRWVLAEDMITRDLPSLQLDILTRASLLVRPGGRLVYATCSISRFENEDVVEMFESEGCFGKEWQPWNFEDIGTNYRSILPHRDESDGFFIARWKRKM